MQMQTWMLRKYDVICADRYADAVRYKKYAKTDACVDEICGAKCIVRWKCTVDELSNMS